MLHTPNSPPTYHSLSPSAPRQLPPFTGISKRGYQLTRWVHLATNCRSQHTETCCTPHLRNETDQRNLASCPHEWDPISINEISRTFCLRLTFPRQYRLLRARRLYSAQLGVFVASLTSPSEPDNAVLRRFMGVRLSPESFPPNHAEDPTGPLIQVELDPAR